MGEGGEEVSGERDRESDRRFRVEEGLIIIPQVVLLISVCVPVQERCFFG